VCFQGSGCVIVYHIGVARYLQEHFELDDVTFLAASGGSIVAAMLALGLSMDVAMKENCRLAVLSRRLPFGPFGRILDDVAGAFEALLADWTDEDVAAVLAGHLPQPMLPRLPSRQKIWSAEDDPDGSEPASGFTASPYRGQDLLPPPPQPRPPPLQVPVDASGLSQPRCRLVLSLTHTTTLAPRLMRHYPTKATLVSSVWSSMNLPAFLCVPFRRVQGELYIDGGLTNNAPVASPATVRVSPTDRTADVTPDVPASAAEFMVPGNDTYMQAMHDQGYENAQRRHDLFLARGFQPKRETTSP